MKKYLLTKQNVNGGIRKESYRYLVYLSISSGAEKLEEVRDKHYKNRFRKKEKVK